MQPQKADGTALGTGGHAVFDNGPSDSDTVVTISLTGAHVFVAEYAKASAAIHKPVA